MTKTISRLGDRLLGTFLKKEEAGACTVCPGPCANRAVGVRCSGGRIIELWCTHLYTCDCGCQPNWNNCWEVVTSRSC
ncbi:hypothetical protein BBK82_25720 [Lentzea guizhouensis]|uniref:Uncharacterized protein n=1 Tax=Lentzea guizhouensis TaxID=1586287 RepID=A0A1B2HMK6_9PSEU|nr:hypothetical protein [Lentzea guizhouensis]ANZ38962.1 hypothetical protein BBK82_25720 [Lentzea guizhouensis]